MNRLKEVLKAVVVYLQENPGVATMVGGWVVLALARVGLDVSVNQLYGVAVVLLPLIAGWHLTARHGRAKRAARK